MKKLWTAVLTASLIMCLLTGAAVAATATIILPYQPGDYRSVMGTAVVGRTAYFLVYTHAGMEIWRWQEGMDAAEKAAGGLLRASDYADFEQMAAVNGEEKAKYAITVLFCDGARLLGVNHVNGLIYEISLEGGEPVFTDVATIQDTSFFYRDFDTDRWYWSPKAVAASGGYLYWFSNGWDSAADRNRSRVTCISLTDGALHDLPEKSVSAMCAYRDGQMLYIVRDEVSVQEDGSNYAAWVYDPVKNEAVRAGVIESSVKSHGAISRIAYAPEMDAVLYQDGTRILGVRDFGAEKLYTYVNTQTSGRLEVIGDTLILSTANSTIVRDLVEDLKVPESLQIVGTGFGQAARNFTTEYPMVPLEIVGRQERYDDNWNEALKRQEDGATIDVLVMHTATEERGYQQLRMNGGLLDLSGDPDIKAYVDALYPPFRELVTTEDGRIVAVPVSTQSYTGFFVNRRAMQDMGLTKEDMPTNLVDMVAFLNRWNAEFAQKYPNYACIEYTEDTRWYMLDLMVEMWISYCQATDQPLHFDDPVFREMMAALGTLEVRNTDESMQETNPEVSDYKTGLFWMRCQLVGNWASYMEEYSDRIFIPLTLTKDTPFVACIDNVELWAVNAQTESAEYAMKLLNAEIGTVNEKYRHVLLTTETEPVENPYYADQYATAQALIEELLVELETAVGTAERMNIEAAIADHRSYMNREMLRDKYTVTPSAIENYVDVIAPAMYVHGWNLLEDTMDGLNAIESLMDRWLDGAITTEQFIMEGDARLLMLEMVNE